MRAPLFQKPLARLAVVVSFVVPSVFAFVPMLAVGCDKEQKTPAGGAPSVSASTPTPMGAAAASSAPPPDPKELKYAKLRKDLKDRNLAYMTLLQKIYAGAAKDEQATWKGFFPKTKEGQKEADDIFKEAAFTGKEGMSIATFEVEDISFDEKLLHCTASLSEKQMQRGKPRCVVYKLQWEEQSGTFLRTGKTDMGVVDCP